MNAARGRAWLSGDVRAKDWVRSGGGHDEGGQDLLEDVNALAIKT